MKPNEHTLAEAPSASAPSAMANLLTLEQLQVDSPAGDTLVQPVSLTLAPGEILGLIGESGSGKTTLATALLGHTRRGARIVSGRLTLDGQTLELAAPLRTQAGHSALRSIAYVPQNPGAHLNPSLRLQRIFDDIAVQAAPAEREAALQRALRGAGLPLDAAFRQRYPHQLSGGQQQRVALAAALLREARVLVLDEPTSGLDVLTAGHVVETLLALNREFGLALICVSHDMRFIAQLAQRIAVMQGGRIVELGRAETLLSQPAHAYTRLLIGAVPGQRPRRIADEPAPSAGPALLEVRDLVAHHTPGVPAVDKVSFEVRRGRWVALIGASGSGKTSIAAVLAGLHPRSGGQLLLDGQALPDAAAGRSREQRRRIQIVMQDPQGSLNPRQTVRTAIGRPLGLLRGLSGQPLDAEVLRLAAAVRLPASLLDCHAAELSGGECQRVNIARALAAQPDLLICDEITSALDVSVQASILDLLSELRASLGLSILFISHQLDVVAAVADDIVVLQAGVVVEQGAARGLLAAPRSDWARRSLQLLRQAVLPHDAAQPAPEAPLSSAATTPA